MLKTFSATSNGSADTTTTPPLHWIKTMPNITLWKYHNRYKTQENMHVYQCILCRLYNIVNWRKWWAFCRRHLYLIFPGEYLYSNLIGYWSLQSNWKEVDTSLGNGLMPNRRQALILTDADPVDWRLYALMGYIESTIPLSTHFFLN